MLATEGRIANSRRDMVKGGGKYERVVAVLDPPAPAASASTSVAPTASAIAKDTLERLFREQLQPRAYACYQRALGANPKLAGTTRFHFRMGRGEVTEVQLMGLSDAALDACLLDAAYLLSPPFPDFAINADDQTIANYPLTFSRRADQAVVVLGDADSASPIDIDAVEGGVPGRVKVDARTPLGGMGATRARSSPASIELLTVATSTSRGWTSRGHLASNSARAPARRAHVEGWVGRALTDDELVAVGSIAGLAAAQRRILDLLARRHRLAALSYLRSIVPAISLRAAIAAIDQILERDLRAAVPWASRAGSPVPRPAPRRPTARSRAEPHWRRASRWRRGQTSARSAP